MKSCFLLVDVFETLWKFWPVVLTVDSRSISIVDEEAILHKLNVV